jgi:hypothetical protein
MDDIIGAADRLGGMLKKVLARMSPAQMEPRPSCCSRSWA